jgi:hypothetical protein
MANDRRRVERMASIERRDQLRSFEQNGLRVLSIRKRYVRRAEYLRDHPPFRRDIERRRAEWDAAWPEFAIGTSPIPLDEQTFALGAYSLMPPKLFGAQRTAGEVVKGQRQCRQDEESLSERAWLGVYEWGQFLSAICAKWWPSRYYPLSHYADHLAGRFVAGCLLCFPEYLPADAEDEWIGIPTMQAVGLRAPAKRMVDPALMAYQQEWGNALMARLNDAAEARQVLTPELLYEMWQDADEVGRTAKNACRQEFEDQEWGPDHPHARIGVHWVMPLYPDMKREDLEEGAAQITDALRSRYGEHMLRQDARRLSREGKSDRAIAGLMGVSVSQVGVWTKGPD